jgi:eukaryotic-like serine/threonine-protein kinase
MADGGKVAMSTSYPSLGKYQIIEEIGRGGMGAVYKAYDPFLDRTVAIKVLAPHLVWEKEFIERFAREARAAARLQHSHIIPIHDVGQEGNNYYFVMAYLPGQSLKQRIAQKGQLDPDETLPILLQLASALDYAHGKELVHRDVKPGNVMFNELDEAVLTDFGIVKAVQEIKLTATGAALGTAEYMAPEQVEGKPVDARADQYALGIIAFEMLTGRVPFEGETATAVLHKQVYEPPPSILAFCPDLTRTVEDVVNRALNKSPDKRYASCGEFVKALEAALAQAVARPLKPSVEPERTLTPAPSPIEPPPTQVSLAKARKPSQGLLLIGAGIGVLAIAALVIAAVAGRSGPATPTPVAAIQATSSATPAPTSTLQQTSTPTYTPRPPTQTPTLAPTLRASTPVPPPADVISLNNTNRLAALAEWSGAGHWIAFSPDSKLLATGGIELSLWDVSSGREIRRFTGHTNPLTGIALSPDGQVLASREGGGTADSALRLWEVSSGRGLETIVFPFYSGNRPVAFSPNGVLVATASGSRVRLYEVANGRERPAPTVTGATSGVIAIAFSPDGKMLATASWEKGVMLWDVPSGRQVNTLSAEGAQSLAFSPDGKLLAAESRLWTVASGRELRALQVPGGGRHFSSTFSPDGKLLAVGSESKNLFLFEIASGNLVRTLPHTSPVISVAFSPDGKLLASGAADGMVRVWGAK